MSGFVGIQRMTLVLITPGALDQNRFKLSYSSARNVPLYKWKHWIFALPILHLHACLYMKVIHTDFPGKGI